MIVDWCSKKAARYSVENWHYSGSMPVSKLNTIGVWEDNRFIGSIIFGVGACNNLVKQYGLEPSEGCELVRVALTEHSSFVTQAISKSIKLLKENNPGLRLIVSFADPNEGHHGGIYQAGNWIYTGKSASAVVYIHKKTGKKYHARNVGKELWRHAKVVRPDECIKQKQEGKHRYLYPLDKAMRRKIIKLAQPYPQAEEVSKVIHSTSS